MYFKGHRKYYNGSAPENIFSVALAFNGIAIITFLKTPAFECIFYNTWSLFIFWGTSSTRFNTNIYCTKGKEINYLTKVQLGED